MTATREGKVSCLQSLLEICEHNVNKLFEIWETVGYADVSKRARIVVGSVQQMLMAMVDEEAEYQVNLAHEIEGLLKESSELCQEVGGNYDEITSGLEDSSVPMLEIRTRLLDRLRGIRAIKEQRMQHYHELLEQERGLCASLGLKKRDQVHRIPQEQDLEEMSSWIIEMREQERKLKVEFAEVKLRIDNISSELGAPADTTYHKFLIEDNSGIEVTTQNLKMLKELHQTMEQKLENVKVQNIELREKLSNLWERLHISYEERDEFLQRFPGYNKTSLDALRSEIARCEEKKRQNIKVFIDAVREELADYWEKCCYGKTQCQQFWAFYSHCYTDDLLELHELEVEKMKKYYNENINILSLAKTHDDLWKKMIELDEKAHDPTRLFANRGGQLLRDEKERKVIQKDLPVIKRELDGLLDDYERKTRGPFYYNGEDLRKVLKSMWDTFHQKKEDEKLARKKGKDASSVEKLTVLSGTKRKLPLTNSPAKLTRSNAAASSGSSAKSGGCAMTTSRRVVRRMFAPPSVPVAPKRVQSPEASYTHFEVNLERHTADQEMVRSSVIPSRVLEEINEARAVGKSVVNERVGTPLKPSCKNSISKSCNNLSQFRTPQATRLQSPSLRRSRSAPRLAASRGRLPNLI